MANLAQGWINHLRRQARNNEAAPAEPPAPPPPPTPRQQCPIPEDTRAAEDSDDTLPARKRLKSPTTFVKAHDRTRSPSPRRRTPPPKRGCNGADATADFPVRPSPRTKGRIWNEGDPIPTRTPAPAQSASAEKARPSRRRDNRRAFDPLFEEDEDPSVNNMIWHPETRPISQKQLVAEVKGIYAGLVMVESKCIEVDSSQSAQNEASPKLNYEQWQALISLHRSLIHEHHDFFLSSRHPSASPALKRLAARWTMPVGTWRRLYGALKSSLSMVALAHDTFSNHISCYKKRAFIPDPESTDHRHGYKVESRKPLGTGKLSPEDPSLPNLLMPLWAGENLPNDGLELEACDEKEGRLELPVIPMDSNRRASHGAALAEEDERFRSPGSYSAASKALESRRDLGYPATTGHSFIPRFACVNIPPKLLCMALFTSLVIPVLSAGAGPVECVLGGMAVIPSLLTLANKPVPPEVENTVPEVEKSVEEVILKVFKYWGLSVGPACAVFLVWRLSCYYPSRKQWHFRVAVFVESLVLLLLLQRFTTGNTWSIFELLAVCIFFSTMGTYLICDEFRCGATGGRSADEEMGHLQPHLSDPTRNRSDQHPQVQVGPQPRRMGIESSPRDDGIFIIGNEDDERP